MNLGKFQKQFRDSGLSHRVALEIIEELERALDAKNEILFAYRTGSQLREKTFKGMERFEKYGVE